MSLIRPDSRSEDSRPVRRSSGGGARPVELDSSADPRTAEADKSRFDHMVVIDKVIMIRLVVRSLDPASELRKDHDFQILIFQPDGMVRLILFLIINLFDRRVRIDPAGTFHGKHGSPKTSGFYPLLRSIK